MAPFFSLSRCSSVLVLVSMALAVFCYSTEQTIDYREARQRQIRPTPRPRPRPNQALRPQVVPTRTNQGLPMPPMRVAIQPNGTAQVPMAQGDLFLTFVPRDGAASDADDANFSPADISARPAVSVPAVLPSGNVLLTFLSQDRDVHHNHNNQDELQHSPEQQHEDLQDLHHSEEHKFQQPLQQAEQELLELPSNGSVTSVPSDTQLRASPTKAATRPTTTRRPMGRPPISIQFGGGGDMNPSRPLSVSCSNQNQGNCDSSADVTVLGPNVADSQQVLNTGSGKEHSKMGTGHQQVTSIIDPKPQSAAMHMGNTPMVLNLLVGEGPLTTSTTPATTSTQRTITTTMPTISTTTSPSNRTSLLRQLLHDPLFLLTGLVLASSAAYMAIAIEESNAQQNFAIAQIAAAQQNG